MLRICLKHMRFHVMNVYNSVHCTCIHIQANHPSSPIEGAGYAPEPRRESLIIGHTGPVERDHQAASDDRLSIRVLHKIGGCRQDIVNIRESHALGGDNYAYRYRCVVRRPWR